MTAPPVSLAGLTGSSAHVFRGVCRSAEVGTADVAGARIAVTTYTFEIREHLKGGGGRTLTFRQVGTPSGGGADLGRAAGLPVYSPGLEYMIFLLPESRARLTSPAGASQGALLVSGEDVVVPRDLAGLTRATPHGREEETGSASDRISYREVRDAVLRSLEGAAPGWR